MFMDRFMSASKVVVGGMGFGGGTDPYANFWKDEKDEGGETGGWRLAR